MTKHSVFLILPFLLTIWPQLIKASDVPSVSSKCVSAKVHCPDGRWITVSCDNTANPCGSSSGGSSYGGSSTSDDVGEALINSGIGTEIGTAIGNSLFGDPEQEAAKREQEADRARKVKQQKAAQDEEIKKSLLNTLKSDETSLIPLERKAPGNELGLKVDDDSQTDLRPKKELKSNQKPLASLKSVANKQMKTLNCQFKQIEKFALLMDAEGKDKVKALAKDIATIRADLETPLSGIYNTQTIRALSFSHMTKLNDSEQQLTAKIDLVRHEDSGICFISAIYHYSKNGKLTEGQSVIQISDQGKMIANESSKEFESCLKNIDQKK